MAQSPAPRVALVIGNGGYTRLEGLANPPADAAVIAEALWSAGFEVIELIDADREAMINGIAAFANRLQPGAEAVFYYAGHGVSVGGANYLIPVGAAIDDEADLPESAVTAQTVLRTMEESGAAFNVVILDACRNNPFAAAASAAGPAGRSVTADASPSLRSLQGGLAEMSTGGFAQTLIAYATAPGEVALDGSSGHSPYTEALSQALAEPGIEIGMLFRRVRGAVREKTDGYQIPWTSSTLEREFYFRPQSISPAEAAAGMAATNGTLGLLPPRNVLDRSFWQSIEGRGRVDAIETYLASFPQPQFADQAKRELGRLATGGPLAVAEPSALDDSSFARTILGETGSGSAGTAVSPAVIEETAVPVGVGPASVQLPPLVDTHGPDLWVQIDEAPDHGQLLLPDGKVLNERDVVDVATFSKVMFLPTIGTHGADELLTFSVLEQGGQSQIDSVRLISWVHACDLFAGMPEDQNRVTAGTRQVILNQRYLQAIIVCEMAVEDYPDVGRFQLELARAYRAASRYKEAVIWNERAIERGHTVALVVLGQMYWDGQAVPQDHARAREMFEQAWQANETAAGTAIAAMYRFGAGVEQSYEEAMSWYQRTAHRGNDWAMTNIGELYQTGKGVEQDIDEAVRWYTRAARSGELTAQTRLARIYELGEGVAINPKEAQRWYRSAAGQGVANAMTRLGVMMESGSAGEASLTSAVALYEHAAQLGDGDAIYRLGRLYRDGKGVKKDEALARSHFLEAINVGHYGVERELGQLYAQGRGGARNELEALRLYQIAARDNAWAERDIGQLYTNDGELPVDYGLAAQWFRLAAMKGVGWAARDLARLHDFGQGMPANRAEAIRWYGLAMADGQDDQELQKRVRERLAELPEKIWLAGAQLMLAEQGYDVGTPDGIMGARTRAALAAFAGAQDNAALAGEDGVSFDTLATLAKAWREGER